MRGRSLELKAGAKRGRGQRRGSGKGRAGSRPSCQRRGLGKGRAGSRPSPYRLLTLSLPLAMEEEEEEEDVPEELKSELEEASGPSVELGEGCSAPCSTLTSSAQSEGVTAESGPSVVVWELSLGGDEVGRAPSGPPEPLAGPELGLSTSSSPASSSSSSSSSGEPGEPRSEEALSSTESPGCRPRWEERGCSVMMSAGAREAEGGGASAPSPVTEAVGGGGVAVS